MDVHAPLRAAGAGHRGPGRARTTSPLELLGGAR